MTETPNAEPAQKRDELVRLELLATINKLAENRPGLPDATREAIEKEGAAMATALIVKHGAFLLSTLRDHAFINLLDDPQWSYLIDVALPAPVLDEGAAPLRTLLERTTKFLAENPEHGKAEAEAILAAEAAEKAQAQG